jgi:hypothetical protein
MVDDMSWLLKTVFADEAALKQGMQISRSGVGTVYASASLPLEPGDPFVLEATVTSYGFQRWATGVVRARGTGVLTLQLPEARHFLRRDRGFAVLARRSTRYWAGLPVQALLKDKGGQPVACELLEASADGVRLRGDCGAAGKQVELVLPLGALSLPLGLARVCWRTPQQAGLKLLSSEGTLTQLLRVLASRWRAALPLLAPGEPAPPLPPRPQPLEETLAIELAPRPRPDAAKEPEGERQPAAGFGRLVPGH